MHNAPHASLNNYYCSQEKRRDRSASKIVAQEANKQLEFVKPLKRELAGF